MKFDEKLVDLSRSEWKSGVYEKFLRACCTYRAQADAE